MKKIALATVSLGLLMLASCRSGEEIQDKFLASGSAGVTVYRLDDSKQPVTADTLPRGLSVRADMSGRIRTDSGRFIPVRIGRGRFLVEEGALVDSLKLSVQEKSLFVRTPASIIDDTTCAHICGLARKGADVEILGHDRIDGRGRVHRYKVRCGGWEGYVFGKYLTADRAEALGSYLPEVYDTIHAKVRNPFGAGEASGCDYFPVEKPSFPDNVRPETSYSLYLNNSPVTLGKIEEYIALAKQSLINTFVIDIKDNECPAYKADAMKLYSPTNYARAGAKQEQAVRHAVERLHEEGFYVIGRITCFKDTYFVKDNPDAAITEKATGEPLFYNNARWPSAFDRKVWQFNVELAKEAVRKFGFNEINFDYVRFPDRMLKIEDTIDYHDKYGETKVQAIQRFVQYACDEIHETGAYVSVDVFGESAMPGYTTAYGQYWPAISNVVDVICGMPYPDHFANRYFGIDKPWNHPYRTLRAWGRRVEARQSEIPTPAVPRTWIQAYHVMKHVDPNGIDYDAGNVELEIRALFDAGLTGGYITWMSTSSLDKYTNQLPAFCIDYIKEEPLQEERQEPVLQ